MADKVRRSMSVEWMCLSFAHSPFYGGVRPEAVL